VDIDLTLFEGGKDRLERFEVRVNVLNDAVAQADTSQWKLQGS